MAGMAMGRRGTVVYGGFGFWLVWAVVLFPMLVIWWTLKYIALGMWWLFWKIPRKVYLGQRM